MYILLLYFSMGLLLFFINIYTRACAAFTIRRTQLIRGFKRVLKRHWIMYCRRGSSRAFYIKNNTDYGVVEITRATIIPAFQDITHMLQFYFAFEESPALKELQHIVAPRQTNLVVHYQLNNERKIINIDLVRAKIMPDTDIVFDKIPWDVPCDISEPVGQKKTAPASSIETTASITPATITTSHQLMSGSDVNYAI